MSSQPASSTPSVTRPRKRATNDLPPSLYERHGGYFVYLNRITGQTVCLGRIPRTDAIQQAIEANTWVDGELSQQTLLQTIQAESGPQFSAWLEKYQAVLDRRGLAATTMRQNAWRMKTLHERFGAMQFAAVSNTRTWADFLDSYVEAGKSAQATLWRSFLLDLWREAVAQGWLTTNPVAVTRNAVSTVKRARLTLDDFIGIHQEAIDATDRWLPRAMELAILTGQRREDIAALEFRRRADSTAWAEKDMLYIRQIKTGAQIAVPVDMRLQAIGMSLKDVISRCRDSIASPWMIHHVRHQSAVKPGDRVHLDRITKRFAEARDAYVRRSGVAWGDDKEPPSFHELRSLSIRLWTDQEGSEFAQALAGHKDARMTAKYQDARGSEWVKLVLTAF